MQATNRTRRIATALTVSLVAAALIGAAAWNPEQGAPVPPAATSAGSAHLVGVPTGESQNGLAVYRLPSIAVTVSRSEALARMAREDAAATR